MFTLFVNLSIIDLLFNKCEFGNEALMRSRHSIKTLVADAELNTAGEILVNDIF